MRALRTFLLITLLAGGLYSQSPRSVPPQGQNTVALRSRITTQQPGVPEVKAVANPSRVPVGAEVTFTLSPASVVKNPCYEVTLLFGDGQRQVARQTQIVHSYGQSGNYTYSILVQPIKNCPSSVTPSVTAVPDVRLVVTPSAVEVNQSVTFVAELSQSVPGYSYRFFFGDGSVTAWQNDPNATHVYRQGRTYQPYVDIGVFQLAAFKQVGGSRRLTITVSERQSADTNANRTQNDNRARNGNGNARSNDNQKSSNTRGNRNTNANTNGNGSAANGNTRSNNNQRTLINANTNGNQNAITNDNRTVQGNANPQGSPTESVSPSANSNSPGDWVPYLVFLPLLALAGYKGIKYFLMPRPTFVPTPDVGKAKTSGFGFDYQVDVDPNVDGAFKINAEGESLIKGMRKSDD